MNRNKRQKATGQHILQPTEKGFKLGPVEIERIETEDISGSALLGLKTEDINLEIFVTRAGMVGIYVPIGEMVMVCGAEREKI